MTCSSLDHSSKSVAAQIYDIFQLSYKVEASLIGVSDFPPLRRDVSQIQSSTSRFLGRRVGADLAAVVEFSQRGETLSVDGMAVHPKYFRRGIANELLQSLLAKEHWQIAEVETAAANNPALMLYQKFGFSESKRWTTADGIEKVKLIRRNIA